MKTQVIAETSSMQDQNEQAGPPIDRVALEKQQAKNYIRQGESRGRHLELIWGYKLAEARLRLAGIGVDIPERHGEGNQAHDWMDTGDPCWCGSDNCTVCLVCLEQNHD